MVLVVAALLATAAPPLQLTDASGAPRRLADYRGKVVLVNFWATWCEPCLAELPSIEKLRAALAGKPFAVLAVQTAGSARSAGDRGEELGLRFPLLPDRDSSVTAAWGVTTLPTSFLIDAKGAIAFTRVGEWDWSSAEARRKVEALLPRGRKVSCAASGC